MQVCCRNPIIRQHTTMKKQNKALPHFTQKNVPNKTCLEHFQEKKFPVSLQFCIIQWRATASEESLLQEGRCPF